jgi:nicotinic acid mononucleotide adenylyltransferase/predicted short-subunit dehydrogenase-like oxidoreductase (DUF2520 family)
VAAIGFGARSRGVIVEHVKSFRAGGKTIGVLGGAFDPPHVGHALLPGYLLARGLVDRVIVAPVADHPLGKSMRPMAERLAMTRAAMALYDDRVVVDDIEAELAARHGGASVSLRLLEAIAAREPGSVVRLVVGADIVASGETSRWHRWDEIERRFAPIVVPRVGFSPPGECALPWVSSTEIRAWLASGDPEDAERLAAALPAEVLAWLRPPSGPPVWIVGQGNVATHAVPWLRGRGFGAIATSGRDVAAGSAGWPAGEPEPAAIWVLVRDPAIEPVAEALARADLPRHVPVLHGAGARVAAEVLAPAASAGHPVGTLHPICALRRERPFPSPLPRAAFGLEGDPAARDAALRLLGDRPWLDLQGLSAEARRAYHGACALVANHLAVPWDAGAAVLRDQGHAPELVDTALRELLRSALDNLLALGIPAGITGPIARGDTAAAAAHVAALPPEAASLYAELSRRLAALMGPFAGWVAGRAPSRA